MARRPKIVVVDDDQASAQILRTYLERGGYQVVAHTRAEAALQHLTTQSADLLITDFILDTSTGVELIRELRNQGNTLPVILVSGSLHEGVIRPARALGVEWFITKPIVEEHLLSAAGTVLRRPVNGSNP